MDVNVFNVKEKLAIGVFFIDGAGATYATFANN
jgi:hypothetical protein